MNPFLNSFTSFIKKINSKTSSKEIMEAIPNLYPELDRFIYIAIQDEVNQYNISEGKKELLRHKLEGSIAATFNFDEDFINKLNVLTDEKDKIYLVRKYVREYVKKEVNLETANLISEARNKIINADSENPRSFFSIMDPRWKKDSKPGDYSQYKKYRDEVTGYLFPQAEVAGATVSESESRKYNKDLLEQYNSGGLPLTSSGTGSVVSAESSLNSIIDSRHRNMQKGTQVYNSAAGDFLDLDQQIILSNINKEIKSGLVKENLTEKQKIELLRAVQAGDEATASKYLKDKKSAKKVVSNLSQTRDRVQVSGGRARFASSEDSISGLRSSSVKEFGDKVKKNPRGAMNNYQESHLVSNITSTRVLIQKAGTTVNPELLNFVKKNELLLNISTLGNALKDVGKLTGSAAANLASIKTSVLNAVNRGEIKFTSELEKKAFLRALDKNDAAYFKSFTTPGLVGKGTYSRLMAEVNESAVELAGKYNSPDLASKALNFNNQISLFKKNVLDNYIYIAQLGFDQGYVVSEIKEAIKSTRFGQMAQALDSAFTWEKIKKDAQKQAIKLTIKFGKLVGKDVNQGDLENILGIFSGEKTIGDLLKARGIRILEKFLERFGSKIKFGVEFTWKNFLKSKFVQDAKLKLLKNLRFVEKGLGLLFKKIPFVPYLGKLFSRGWGYIGGFAARMIRPLGSIFPGMGGIFGRDDVLTQRIFIAAVGCSILWLLPFLFVLLSMMTFTGGLNSTSSSVTNYQPGLVNDIVLSGFAPFEQTIIASDISTSNSFCVSPKVLEQFESEWPNWNNLSLKDFDGTDDANVCKIMCNARKYLAGLTPGANGALSCNFNKSILYNPDKYNEYVCADFVVDAFRDDDPEIVQGGRLVVQIDRYLKLDATTKYNRVDLATPNNPDDEPKLSDYNFQCTELENFKPGNILIIRANTCNDIGIGNDPRGLEYLTLDNAGRRSKVNSGHIEIILKVSGSGDKRTLYTLNANNVAKKVSHVLTKCPSQSPSGNDTYRMQVKNQGTVLRGGVLDENDKQIEALQSVLTTGYPCRMYQIKERPSVTCPETCQIPPSNYPDKSTYVTP